MSQVDEEDSMVSTKPTTEPSSANSSVVKPTEIIKVAATSRSTAVAGAIAGEMRAHRYVEVQAIGAGAVNQAVKALAIAYGYLDADGISLMCVPSFWVA